MAYMTSLSSACLLLVILIVIVVVFVFMFVTFFLIVIVSMIAIHNMRRHEVVTYARKYLYAKDPAKKTANQSPGRCLGAHPSIF